MHLSKSVETLALRLGPGADIRRALEALADSEKMSAAVIMGAVGSLAQVCLRYADQDIHTQLAGKHEILTLSGMLSQDGVHLHMMVANSQGDCKGGHVVYGCQVYTTLELAIALLPDTHFQRVFDQLTGFDELKVSSKLD
ncbi:MAG: PPC domain-containing DNA-binding protein [Phormidesmis sp.]